MIRESFTKTIAFFSLLTVMGLMACENINNGIGDTEPPEIPEIAAAQPDLSYFSNEQYLNSNISFGDAFSSAQSTAWTSQFLYAFGMLGTSYFYMAESTEPDFVNGEWVWNYDALFEGESIDFRLTANVYENSSEAEWTFYISGVIDDQTFNNYKYMEGTVAIDSKRGKWQIYNYLDKESADPALSYEWKMNIYDDLKATYYLHNDDSFSSLEYDEEGPDNTFSLYGTDKNIEIYWNSKAEHGYWWQKIEDQKLCWTADRSDVLCSEIGL